MFQEGCTQWTWRMGGRGWHQNIQTWPSSFPPDRQTLANLPNWIFLSPQFHHAAPHGICYHGLLSISIWIHLRQSTWAWKNWIQRNPELCQVQRPLGFFPEEEDGREGCSFTWLHCDLLCGTCYSYWDFHYPHPQDYHSLSKCHNPFADCGEL